MQNRLHLLNTEELMVNMRDSLIQKYNVPGPRYTSYPTVPYWEEAQFSLEQWKQTLKTSFAESNSTEGISLYIHLPFCESLCTFCGCHKRVTKKHEMEQPYIQAVLKEWSLYCDLLEDKPRIKEIHLGGGTPTFFSPVHLTQLIEGILAQAEIAEQYELALKGIPTIPHGRICKPCMTWAFAVSVMGCRIIMKPYKKPFIGYSLLNMSSK